MAEDKQNKKIQEEINSLKQTEIELTNQLVALRNQLAAISAKDAKNLEKIKSLQEKILELETKSQNVSKQIVDTQGKILTTQESISDSKDEELDTSEDLLNTDKSRQVVSEKMKKQIESIKDSLESTRDLADKILATEEMRGEVSDRVKDSINETNKRMEVFEALSNDTNNDKSLLVKMYGLINDASAAHLDLETKASEATRAAAEGKLELIDYSQLSTNKQILENKLKSAGNDLTEDAKAAIQAEIDLLGSKINTFKEINDLNKEAVKTYEEQKETLESLGSVVEGALGKMSGMISKVPGGDMLMKHFGFDKMGDTIKNNVGGALNNVISGFKTGGIGGVKGMMTAVQSLGKAMLVGPQAVIFAIIAAVGMLIDLFMDLDAAVSETQKQLGGTKREASAAYEAAGGMAREMNLVGVNAKEVVKGMATVSEIMGGIKMNAQTMNAPGMKEMVKDATLLSEKYGMSKEEIENVHSLSIMTGKSMATLAGEAIKVAGGVMSSKEAVKLLGGISKDVVVSFKGGTKELIAAAAKAKMLGTDLKKVKDIGMGMLDIESSLEKQLEAQVLTGKNLNLDKARQYALTGDVVGLQEELLNQAGSLEEFQKMGPLQQKAMADAMGMSVEEMTEMLTKAEEMEKLGLDRQLQEDLANATAEEKANIYKKQGDMLKAQGDDEAARLAYEKAAQEESASAAEKFGDIMSKIKDVAMKLVTPILDMVHGLMDGVQQGGGLVSVFDGIITTLRPIMEILMGVGKIIFQSILFPFKLIWAVVDPIFSALKEIFASFSAGEDGAGGIASIFDTISGVMTTIQDVISGIVNVFVTGLLEPSKILLTAIITPLWDTFKGIFDTVKKAFEPLFGANKEGEKTVGIMETIKKVTSFIAPILELIGGLIADYLMKPFELAASAIQIIIKLFTGDFTGALNDLGSHLFEMFLGMPKMIISAITGIIDNIFGTNLTESVTGFFDFIEKGFQTVTGFIEPIFGYVKEVGGLLMDLVLQPFKSIWGVIQGIGKIFTGDLVGGLQQIGTAISDFFMAPINYVMGLFDALVGLFTGIGDKIKNAVKDLLPGWALSLLGLGGEEPAAAPAAEQTKSDAGGGATAAAVPAMATGGDVEKAGVAVVGERGPELVALPQGASVASTGATDQVASVLAQMADVLQSTMSAVVGVAGEGGGKKSDGESGGGIFDTIGDFAEGVGGIIGGVTGGAVGALTGQGGGTDMSKVEQKLDALISLFTQAANQPTVIKFGDKFVEEIKGQLAVKKSFTGGLDNGYGRSL